MADYQIGQILYVISRNESKVYPVQVVEEMTKKTLNGVEKSYSVKVGTKEKGSIHLLSSIAGEVFSSSDEARNVLQNRATTAINKIVDEAIKYARKYYGDGPVTVQLQNVDIAESYEEDDDPYSMQKLEAEPKPRGAIAEVVELPDGTKAKLNYRNIAIPERNS